MRVNVTSPGNARVPFDRWQPWHWTAKFSMVRWVNDQLCNQFQALRYILKCSSPWIVPECTADLVRPTIFKSKQPFSLPKELPQSCVVQHESEWKPNNGGGARISWANGAQLWIYESVIARPAGAICQGAVHGQSGDEQSIERIGVAEQQQHPNAQLATNQTDAAGGTL